VQKENTLFKIYLSLPPKWFGIRSQRTTINRESGANPEQSRCCEAQFNVL